MSKDKAPEAAPKKGGKMKKLLVVGVGGTALIGAGAGAGIYLGGGLGEHKATPQDNYPKLVVRSEKEEAASGEGGEGARRADRGVVVMVSVAHAPDGGMGIEADSITATQLSKRPFQTSSGERRDRFSRSGMGRHAPQTRRLALTDPHPNPLPVGEGPQARALSCCGPVPACRYVRR